MIKVSWLVFQSFIQNTQDVFIFTSLRLTSFRGGMEKIPHFYKALTKEVF